MSDVNGSVIITAEFLQKLGVPYSSAENIAAQLSRRFVNGTGDNQADAVVKFQVVPGASATVEIDLDDGTLTDIRGTAVTFTQIRGFVFWADTANADAVHLKHGAATPWTTGYLKGTAPEVPIPPNGYIVGICPKASTGVWTVTAGSATIGFDNQNGAGAGTVTGIIWGKD